MEGKFDRRSAEMFGLELAMLAKAHGLKVAKVEVTGFERSAKAQRPGLSSPIGLDRRGKVARRRRAGV